MSSISQSTFEVLTARLKAEQESRLQARPEYVQERFQRDPLGFVKFEWNWGKETLAHTEGPDELQQEFLSDLGHHIRDRNFDGKTPVDPIKMNISSAHGCGKGTMGAWIAWYLLRCWPFSVGTVTAGTWDQAENRTWADIMYWAQLGKGANQFDIQKTGIFHKNPKYASKWKATLKASSKERAQSFAGQHSAISSSWFLFDECSEIASEIWEPCYFGMTDGMPIFLAWGQMVRNSGEFYNVAFGDKAKDWDTRIWDGRKSRFTNKNLIKEIEEESGIDSDRFRVRVLGLPPRASSLQFINQDLVDDARRREIKELNDEPLVVGLDAANGGQAKFVFAFRRGLDGQAIPPIVLPGDTPREVVVAKACEILGEKNPSKRAAALFIDQAFGSVIAVHVKNSGFSNCFEVNFGSSAQDKHYYNNRSMMWGRMKEWLELGSVPNNEKLAQQLLGPGFHHRNGKLVLESKEDMAKRHVASPDFADALALTFYRKVTGVSRPNPFQLNARVRTRERWELEGKDTSQRWMAAIIAFVSSATVVLAHTFGNVRAFLA